MTSRSNLPKPPLVWAIPFSSHDRKAHLIGSDAVTKSLCEFIPTVNRELAEITLAPPGGLCKSCSQRLGTLSRAEITGEQPD